MKCISRSTNNMEELFKDDNVSRKFIKLLIDRIDDVKLKNIQKDVIINMK